MIDIQKEIEKKFPNINKKDNFLKKSLFKIAKKIVHEDSINNFLTQNAHLKGFEFVDAVLDYFDFVSILYSIIKYFFYERRSCNN